MSINLRILPLRTVEHYSSQKCLIPREKFSQICRPGLWAKCWFHSTACNEFKNFSICQVFPRNGDDNSVCYLDLSVCKIMLQNEDHQLILDNIEPLNEKDGVVRDIRVSYVLSSETKMIDSISKSFLAEMTQLLLQEFHLSKSCVVMSPEFQRNGVEGVCIDVSEFNDQDTFTITDDVAIQINNICLNANHSINKIVHFEASSFAKARQELDDLMHAVQIQRDSSPSKRMALNSLIVGPVGCGKSYLLEDYLHYYRCNVFRVKTNVLKQYPGETEMELRRIFKAAQHFETHFKPKGAIIGDNIESVL